jgi:hypothetical protein
MGSYGNNNTPLNDYHRQFWRYGLARKLNLIAFGFYVSRFLFMVCKTLPPCDTATVGHSNVSPRITKTVKRESDVLNDTIGG